MFSLLFFLLAQCSCRTQVQWKSFSICVLQILLLHAHAASLGVVKFKSKDQKYLGTLLIFTLIPLMSKKFGLSISLYVCSRENKRMFNTHIQTILFSYKILYVSLLYFFFFLQNEGSRGIYTGKVTLQLLTHLVGPLVTQLTSAVSAFSCSSF